VSVIDALIVRRGAAEPGAWKDRKPSKATSEE